jgi:hypothetical protein
MSNSSAAPDHSAVARTETGGDAADTAGESRPALLEPVEAVAFWAAIALPFLYLPLFVTGPDTTAAWSATLGLVVVHVLALYLGRSHNA